MHIYLGTIGMEGAYRAMRDGYVDESWAKHHHLRWYEEVVAGKAPREIREAGGGAAGSRAAETGDNAAGPEESLETER